MRIEFFPAAELEFDEAAGRYEEQLRGLGSEFAAEVERITGLLREHHALGEKLDKTHRRIPLRRFPFGIIYRVDGETIHVVAIAHRRRRPSYWGLRVQDR